MNILFLTQILPYPPDAGPKVKTWHVLRYLVEQGHQVTLASFVRTEEEAHLGAVREVVHDLHPVPIRRSRLTDAGYWLRSLWSGRPFLVERDDMAEMHAVVRRVIGESAIDVVHADQLTMTQFAFRPTERQIGRRTAHPTWPATIFDAHNAVWTIVERMKGSTPAILGPVLDLEARRVLRYEGAAVRSCDATLAVTRPDRQALIEAVEAAGGERSLADRIRVIPIAVDTRQLTPVQRKPGSKNIVTLGTLHYPPNADGIRWFALEIFPLIHRRMPDATLTIIGKNPPADFRQLAAQNPEAIRVTGYVPDLVPHLEQAALMAVPVRAGGGMRVRILEAFARGMPVVTTTVGLEGIEAQPGEDVVVADSAENSAQAVLHLLENPAEQSRLATSGRALVESKYDWQVVLRKLDEIYHEIAPF